MILTGEPEQANGERATLDQLFRRAAVRCPDALALADPPNRGAWTEGAARQLTFLQADRAIWAMAARLRALGLQTDAVVALQLPNTVEHVLALLGILRAGMIAALVPPLWRSIDMTAALSAVGAKAIVTTAKLDGEQPRQEAMRTAAGVFSVRHVLAFGRGIADGVVALDDIFDEAVSPAFCNVERSGNPAAHIAAITFDTTVEGIVPVARNHCELIAGGLAVVLEGRLAPDRALLSAIPLASFAALSASLVPWLIGGGTLALHQPFDAAAFAQQQHDHRCGTIVVPQALAERLAAGGVTTIALWRAPEQLSGHEAVEIPSAVLDVIAFGEVGLIAASRDPQGVSSPIARGVIVAPSGSPQAIRMIETARIGGRLALRGPMVPAAAFPVGRGRGCAEFEIDEHGFVDTAYPCRADGEHLIVSGPQPGIVGIGGIRFSRAGLDAPPAGTGMIAAVPNALLGQRLAGSGKLASEGHHALLAQAFRPRAGNAA